MRPTKRNAADAEHLAKLFAGRLDWDDCSKLAFAATIAHYDGSPSLNCVVIADDLAGAANQVAEFCRSSLLSDFECVSLKHLGFVLQPVPAPVFTRPAKVFKVSIDYFYFCERKTHHKDFVAAPDISLAHWLVNEYVSQCECGLEEDYEICEIACVGPLLDPSLAVQLLDEEQGEGRDEHA